ncbi:MAG TPA: hypothetical protein VIL35_16715 [Vicinamibacterales bacterium]
MDTREHSDVGLCARCRWMRLVQSARGSRFYRCGRSDVDRTYPRYPRLPVLDCRGYEPAAPDMTSRD